jgi:transcriptional regulator with XRE-family HTH domain
MTRIKRPAVTSEALRLNAIALARAGGEVRTSRERHRWTQAELGGRSGTSASAIGRIERGKGGTATVDTWQRIGVALGRAFEWGFARDADRETVDAGHLAIQELLLRLGREQGYNRTFEAATKPADPAHSVDVRLRSDRHRRLLVLEAWNSFGDIGGAARSFDRKLAETEHLAIAIGHGEPYRVHGCWVVRATARNRALIARYPEVFASRFPGSSERWVRTLTQATEPPQQTGLVWCDVASTRLFAWRRRT